MTFQSEYLIFTDAQQGSVEIFNHNHISILVGNPSDQHKKAADGANGISVQPTGIYVEQKTILLCDSANKSVRLIISETVTQFC